ncbi:hypothetical protein Vafri_2501, partial [Volvox africanus]
RLISIAMLTLRAINSASSPRLFSSRRNALPRRAVMAMATNKEGVKLDKSTPDNVWKEVLSAEEFYILRQKGTERAGTGLYNKFYEDGVYKCAGCETPLYKSETKFNSGCGWPAFYDEIPGAVDRHVDNSYGMRRVEITCANCGGHLGHVFEGEGFPTPTNQRHCVNSVSIKFDPKK